jgi:hypothetical protein
VLVEKPIATTVPGRGARRAGRPEPAVLLVGHVFLYNEECGA